MRSRHSTWHRMINFGLAALALPIVTSCGSTAPDLTSPAGRYELKRVNNNGVPALIFLNETPFFKQLWHAGSMTVEQNGRWVDSLVIETVTAQSDSLTTLVLAGSYTAYPDHVEFMLDPGTTGEWQAVEDARPVDGNLQVQVTPTTSFFFGFPR